MKRGAVSSADSLEEYDNKSRSTLQTSSSSSSSAKKANCNNSTTATMNNDAGSSEYRPNDKHFATKATHVGQEPEQWHSMSVVPHISMATTFKQDGPADYRR